MKPLLRTALLALLLAAFACSGDAERGRLILIGIDGATFRIIDPLIEAGRLPQLAALRRDGASGPLRSIQPILSPRIWNTISTGKMPNKHGIKDFARKQADGSQQLYLSTDRKARALWNIASDSGRSVAVINWWNTYPPDRIDGVMISDHVLGKEVRNRAILARAEDAPGGPLTFPQAWEARLAAIQSADRVVSDIANPFTPAAGLPHWLKGRLDGLTRHFRQDAQITRIALAVEDELHADLTMVFLPGIDRVSHFLWGMLEPASLYPEVLHPTDAERAAGRGALYAHYEYVDDLIGELIRPYGDDDLVVVVSDHGFEHGLELALLTGTHLTKEAIDGVFFARGRGVPAGHRVTGLGVADITPTLLTWLGLPVGRDMDGRAAHFLETPPPEEIATYDIGPVDRLPLTPSGLEDQIVDQLRGLGYIE